MPSTDDVPQVEILLRPHHALDIVTKYGQGHRFQPAPSGNAESKVAEQILNNLDIVVRWVIGADAICAPCALLNADGLCTDGVPHTHPPMSKQDYNDALDRRLCTYLGITPGSVSTLRAFLEIANAHTPGIEQQWHQPKYDPQMRVNGWIRGFELLGIRPRS